MRVCINITSRGNYAKQKVLYDHLDADDRFEPQVIYGGPLSVHDFSFVKNGRPMLAQKEAVFIVEGGNPVGIAKSAGLAIIEYASILKELDPDVLLVVADRFEVLSLAMAAKCFSIPIAHLEGGESSGSMDDSFRHAITKLADLHFPCTGKAAERIETMGENPACIYNVGSTSLDVLKKIALLSSDSTEWFSSINRWGVGALIEPARPYLLVVFHPVSDEYSTIYVQAHDLIDSVNSFDLQAVWIWPNMDVGTDMVSKAIRDYRERHDVERIRFIKALPIEVYGPLLKNAACIVGNSSSGIREAGYLGTPCLNIGSRQNGREAGPNVMHLPNPAGVADIMPVMEKQVFSERFEPDYLYGNGDASTKIIDALLTWKS